MLRRASVRASRLAIRQRHPPHQGPRSVSGRRRGLSSRAKRSRQETRRRLCGSWRPRRDTARHKARQKQQGCFGEALVVLDPLTPLHAALLALQIMPEALVMLPQPVFMDVEVALGGFGQLLGAGHRPVRGRDSGVDETNDIQPIRHNATPVLAGRQRERHKKGSECQGRPPVRGRDPSTSKGHAPHLESKRRSL